MNKLLVSYDLIQPVRNYVELYEILQKINYAKPLESVWLIKTNESAKSMRDLLGNIVDANDKLYVVDITGKDSAWLHLTNEISRQIINA